MKQIIDRIAYSILGIIAFAFIEGLVTMGSAFHFEEYNWMGYTVQGMIMYIAIWVANKAYDAENPPAKKPIAF